MFESAIHGFLARLASILEVTLGGADCIFCPPWPLQRTSRKNRNPGHLNIQTNFRPAKPATGTHSLPKKNTNLPTSSPHTVLLSFFVQQSSTSSSSPTVDRFLPLHKLAASSQPRRHRSRPPPPPTTTTTLPRTEPTKTSSNLPSPRLLLTPRGPRSVVRACSLSAATKPQSSTPQPNPQKCRKSAEPQTTTWDRSIVPSVDPRIRLRLTIRVRSMPSVLRRARLRTCWTLWRSQ